MSGVLLKKKKVIIRKTYYEPRVWRTRWASWRARRLRNKIKGVSTGVNLLKRKSKTSPHKKYKLFKRKIRPTASIARAGDGKPVRGVIGFCATRACKLNFSTMLGIKKKSEFMKKYIRVGFKKFPNLLLTRKSTGHRMGKGKGKFSARITKFKKGEIIFEISYLDLGVFSNCYKAITKSFPVPVKAVKQSPLWLDALNTCADSVKNFKARGFAKKRRY